MGRHTLDDLAQAKAELESWQRRFDNYSGNNPDKYQSQLRQARQKVRLIESALKADGILPKSDQEKLEETLDRLFPDAQSKQIVEFEGERYQRRFTPLERSRSRKTVTAWDRSWVKLPPGA